MSWPSSHFRLPGLRRIAENGVRSADVRERLLLHLGVGCATCAGHLERLAAELEPGCWIPEDTSPDDLLARALRRWLQAAAGRPEVAGLAPVHAEIAAWARYGREPMAFLRLLLEETRHCIRRSEAADPVGLLNSSLRDLESFFWISARAGFPKVSQHPGSWERAKLDLMALAFGCLGMEFARAGHHTVGSLTHQSAKVLFGPPPPLAEPGSDKTEKPPPLAFTAEAARREILATLEELDAELVAAEEQAEAALRHLEVADGLLRDTSIPGRRAETRVRWASAHLLLDQQVEAKALLLEAEPEARSSGCQKLWLEVVHLLAVAHLQHGEPQLAFQRIHAAAELYDRWAVPQLLGERDWLLGVALLARPGAATEALEHLEAASSQLWQLGSKAPVVDILGHLLSPALEPLSFSAAARWEPQIWGLQGSEWWSVDFEARLRQFLARARRAGVELPTLQAMFETM